MKRRAFIGACIVGIGISHFTLSRLLFKTTNNTALAQPKFLSQLCDNKTIQMLGRAYLKLKPDEASDEILWNDVLTERPSNRSPRTKDTTTFARQIEQRIKQDFSNENIVVVDGWILSVTEARQCAIFSMMQD